MRQHKGQQKRTQRWNEEVKKTVKQETVEYGCSGAQQKLRMSIAGLRRKLRE